MDEGRSVRPVGWIQQLRRRKLQHLVGSVLTAQSETPAFIQSFNNIYKKKLIMSVLFYSLLTINLAMFVYQSAERILHHLDEPTAVDAYLIETTHGPFPYVYIYPIETEDYYNNIRKKCDRKKDTACHMKCNGLHHLPGKDNYKFTDILKYLSNFNYITDAYFKMGKSRINLKVKNYDSVMQPTAQVSSELRLPYANYNYKMIIKLKFPPYCRHCRALIDPSPINYHKHHADVPLISIDTNIRYELKNGIWGRYKKKHHATIILQKYHFTNTKRIPCSNNLDNCLRRCLLKKITCRYPFYEARSLPKCNDTYLKAKYNKLTKFVRETRDIVDHCKCLNLCEVTRQTLTFSQTTDAKSGIDISIFNNHVRTLQESFSYDVISLLCDIGGNVGLYFGMSCLTLLEIFVHFCKPLFIENRRTSSKIKNKIQTMIEETKKTKKTPKQHTPYKKILKFSVFVCLGFLSSYQVYNYVYSYFDYPLIKTISLVRDKIIQFPLIISCHHQNQIIYWRTKVANELKMDCTRVHFLDLLGGVTKLKNAVELWEKSSNFVGKYLGYENWEIYDQTHRVFKSANLSELSTPFGICTVFKKYDMLYNPNKNNIEFQSTAVGGGTFGSQCYNSVAYPNFILPQNQFFHPKHIFHINDHHEMHVDLMRQTLIRVNTPKTPCQANNLVVKCEEKCYEDKLKQEKFYCRLPFMKNTTLPLCMTPETAKKTQKSYLQTQFKTDPQKHCSCLARCEETISLPTIIDQDFQLNKIKIKYSISNNIREVIEDQKEVTIVKLLCQIGSIIGILTGLSIYAFVEYFI